MNTAYLQGQLASLHQLHRQTIQDYGTLVSSLNSECGIFVDCLPNYKISPTLDLSVKKKKEVHNIERIEHEILTQYEKFLQLLKSFKNKKHPEQQALGSRLCARLLPAGHEFNHAKDLLRLAVSFANSKYTRVAQPCMQAIGTLLENEMISESTDHLVSAIAELVKKQQYALNPRVIALLLHIRVAMVDVNRADIEEERSAEKKMNKQDKELARQLQKANARQSRAELAAKQTRIVSKLFVVYLRLMKAALSCPVRHQIRILAPVFEGLIKFAPLVNAELHQQVVISLKELFDSTAQIHVSVKLHGLIAAAILETKDATLKTADWKIDFSQLHDVLLRCLPQALGTPLHSVNQTKSADVNNDDDKSSVASGSSVGSLASEAFSIAESLAKVNEGKLPHAEWSQRVSLVMRCIDVLFLSQKTVATHQVSSIVRKIINFLPAMPTNCALGLITLIHRLFQRFPLAAQMVAFTEGIGFKSSLVPAISSAACGGTDLWELALLRQSFNPLVSRVAKELSVAHNLLDSSVIQPRKQSFLDKLQPFELLDVYAPSYEFRPPPPKPEAHKIKRARTETSEAK